MKFKKFLFVFIAVLLFVITGCLSGIENEEQNIEVQKRSCDEDKYENFKEITNNEEVQKVREILGNAEWKNAMESMSRPPDYRFIFQFNNPKIEAKAVGYEVWVSPTKDTLGIVEASNKYVQLTKENSAILYEILTGAKLFNFK